MERESEMFQREELRYRNYNIHFRKMAPERIEARQTNLKFNQAKDTHLSRASKVWVTLCIILSLCRTTVGFRLFLNSD